MPLAARTTRRGLVAMAAGFATLGVAPVRAQTEPTPPPPATPPATTAQGCSVSFVHGLLRISASCPLMSPAGATMGGTPLSIAPPSHLVEVAQVAAATGALSPHDERVARLQERRERKDRKRQRKHDRRVKRDARAGAR